MELITKPAASRERGVNFLTGDPVQDLADLSHIVLNLRHHSKLFNEHYGPVHKGNKKYWEGKADEWLNNHIKQ